MGPRVAPLLVVLIGATIAAAQPGLNLPPAGVTGFARGAAEDVRRVGEFYECHAGPCCVCNHNRGSLARNRAFWGFLLIQFHFFAWNPTLQAP